MNYYIQGDAAKADQIKAAFEKLGIDVTGFDMCNDNILFFTYELEGGGKVISTTNANLYTANIIKTHPDYQKLELPAEPKFKVGSWITNGKYIRYIVGINNKWYVFDDGMSKYWNDVDKRYHLWTITDAKDGDVLATDNGWTCIFKAFDGYGFSSYCFMDSQKWFCEVGAKGHTLDSRINGDIHPATQKQRNLFFKKMQEAGYQWYAGKKELRKIIEPKFKMGDWITDGNITIQIEDVRNDCYTYSDGVLYSTITADKVYHLWTIQDAKDGDVLTDGKLIVIFNKLEEPTYKQHIIAYVGLDLCGRLQITEDTWQLGVDKAMPATKEQRDLLFTKMREAGYEWDADKKELRKIQHYDIANFYAGMPVLVRETSLNVWQYVLFSHCYTGGDGRTRFNAGLVGFNQCIPFNDRTKLLLGTNGKPPEEFINW